MTSQRLHDVMVDVPEVGRLPNAGSPNALDMLSSQVALWIYQRFPTVTNVPSSTCTSGDLGNAMPPRKEPCGFHVDDCESCAHVHCTPNTIYSHVGEHFRPSPGATISLSLTSLDYAIAAAGLCSFRWATKQSLKSLAGQPFSVLANSLASRRYDFRS